MQNSIICERSLERLDDRLCHEAQFCTSSDALEMEVGIAYEGYPWSSDTIHAQSLSISKLLALEHLLDGIGRVLLISSSHNDQ